jgi:magnesium chelatase subunit D
VIKEAQDCPVPGELKETGVALRGSLGKVRAKSGRRAEQTGAAHGRYVGAARPIGGLRLGNRIAIDATLRAAAPYQRARRAAADSKCEGIREEVGGQRPGSKGRMAKSPENKRRVIIDPADLRIKKLKHRSGVLFIFLVDTSGSMALGRIGHAKGVMIRMLREAYLHRDSVALIAFRGTTVQVVLEPTSSVELARRAIESMPAGGGTPLAAGLSGAIALAERARKRTAGKTALLVFTDGRVNVPLKPLESSRKSERDAGIRDELEAMGRQLQDHGIGAVVIDTGTWEAKGGRCASIAEALGARYCRLPGSGPDELYREIRNFTDESRVPS